MAQKLLSTGPGSLRTAERKETVDGLHRTSCGSLFQSEMDLGKNEYLEQSRREESIVNVSELVLVVVVVVVVVTEVDRKGNEE